MVEKGFVTSLSGNWTAVVSAVNEVFAGRRFILLAENGDAMKKPVFEPRKALGDAPTHPRGRAFDAACEVRWRLTGQDDRYVVTFLSESGGPPGHIAFHREAEQWEVRASSQKLTGKWNDRAKDWVEVAVPGISGVYDPIVQATPHSLEIQTIDYCRAGLVLMTRYCAVRPYR
jgi:hypothetical protein